MRLKYKSFFLLLFLAQALQSCVESFVMDPHEEKQIVVNCILKVSPSNYSSDIRKEKQTMDLMFLKGKSENELVPITAAKAYLIHGTDTVCYFKHVEGAVWETDRTIEILEEDHYILGIEVQGFEKIKAHTITPSEPMYKPYRSYYRAPVYSPLVEDSYKLWVFAHKDEDHKESFEYFVTDHQYADDFNITSKRFSDFGYEGDERVWKWMGETESLFRLMSTYPNLPLHKDFLRIDHPKDYKNPNKNPNADIVVVEPPYCDPFFLYCGPYNCNVDFANTKEFADGTIGYKVEPNGHLHVYSLSDEYDAYLKEVYLKLGKLDNDLTAIYSEENLYTNIEGGIGIFGSYCTWENPAMMAEEYELYIPLP